MTRRRKVSTDATDCTDGKATAAEPTAPSNNLGGFKLRRGPFKEGQCQECAVEHDPALPHNQQSLFWQYHFMERNGRWPTWADAMAHCSPEMKAFWIEELAKHGVVVPVPSVSSVPSVVKKEQ